MLTFVVASSNSIETSNVENEETFGKHYEKPKITDEFVEVPQIKEKQWFEYVKFNMTNPQVYQDKTYKQIMYLPSDFSLSSIMEITPLNMKLEIGADALKSPIDYSTATSVSVNYERSSGFAWGLSESFDFSTEITNEAKAGFEYLGLSGEISSSISTSFGFSIGSTQDWHYDESVSISRTFDAIVENGIIKPWRIVEYKVMLPIYVNIYINDVLIKEGYYICHIMSGLCREWADGYIEHWSSGQRVTESNFYGECFTQTKLTNILMNGW